MKLSNSYASLGESFYKESRPASFKEPQLCLWNSRLAEELEISDEFQQDPSYLAQFFSGNQTLDGSKPIATAYAGHQFGHFVPQLGDGRAHLLGNVTDKFGQQREIQLKGSGKTPFSRGGDGRCALGPAIREFIMSEAMFALGVPTTRSLAVVTTGETVFREHALPGAVITRVASSHLRVGTFQYFAARGDVLSLQKLCDYAIARHYPALQNEGEHKVVLLFDNILEKQIQLLVQWMRVGFIHGVMNTDNTAVSGETIDYGPCAMMGRYDPDTVFSSIDRLGRYAFGQQADMIQWNMARLAECLLPLVDDNQDKAVAKLTPMIEGFSERFEQAYMSMMGDKLGLVSVTNEDRTLVADMLSRMKEKQLDYTRTFDALTKAVATEHSNETLKYELGSSFESWQQRLRKQAHPLEQVQQRMRQSNPVVIPRNHHVEIVIQTCEHTGDMSSAEDFLSILRSPYEALSNTHLYQDEATDGDQYYQTFCGT